MSGEGVAIQCPNLVFTLAVHDFHVLAHGFLGRGKAESLVGYGEHAAALLGVDGNVGCKTRFQFQISIWSRNHYLVSYYVVGSCSFQTHLLHGSLEGIIRIGIYGESYSVALLYIADISLVHIGYYLHIGQVLGNGEELWGVEACSYGLTFLYALRNHGSVDRRGDGGVSEVGLRSLYVFLGRGNLLLSLAIGEECILVFIGAAETFLVKGFVALHIGCLIVQTALCAG